MGTFLIVFVILAALAAYAVKTSRAVDQAEEAEREVVEERHKMEMCREAVTDGVCGYSCWNCPWHVEEETEDLTDDR